MIPIRVFLSFPPVFFVGAGLCGSLVANGRAAPCIDLTIDSCHAVASHGDCPASPAAHRALPVPLSSVLEDAGITREMLHNLIEDGVIADDSLDIVDGIYRQHTNYSSESDPIGVGTSSLVNSSVNPSIPFHLTD